MDIIGAVKSIGDALAKAGEIAKPFIDDRFAQKYEREHRERQAEFLSILAEKDNQRRADRLSVFVIRLLTHAGTPVGALGNQSIEIPVDVFVALVNELSEGVKKDALLARMEFKR